ncbi:PTS sugar transporter subunit IIC [candidate division KSB1 bacterium]|nr:PTS sugar transporter subunit IIC [candidate division KSB1 bacterium]MBL7093883.1 PTS sugar transporter subunit IIC [candidate division KSB1 bacterium]
MDIIPAILITSLIGGIIAIDTAVAFQIMISQPIVSCTIIGLIFGLPEIGILVGILLELPWLINIPSGGAHGSEGNLGAVVAAALSSYLVSRNINTANIIIITSIIYSLCISQVGSFLIDFLRKVNLNLVHDADQAVENADVGEITRLNLTGFFYMFVMGFILTGIGFGLGIFILKPLISFIHSDFDRAFDLAKYSILGLGFGVVASLFLTRDTKWYVIAGAAASVLILLLVSF